jgi:hypothetical protein
MTKTTSLRLALKSDSSHLSHSVRINGIICIRANHYMCTYTISQSELLLLGCGVPSVARRRLPAGSSPHFLHLLIGHLFTLTPLRVSSAPKGHHLAWKKTRLVCARQLAFLPGATNKYLPFSFLAPFVECAQVNKKNKAIIRYKQTSSE